MPIAATINTQSDIKCEQCFNFDYSRMRGTDFSTKDKAGRLLTSIDSYRSYCLIIDWKSRYSWVFLTKTKTSPLSIVKQFLAEHGNKSVTRCTIRTDQGEELWNSDDFCKQGSDSSFLLEPTVAGAPFQNSLAEWLNQTYGNMVRCLLHSANFGPEYGSFALVNAVYLKNRLPHCAVPTTPYQEYTGHHLSAKFLGYLDAL
jgi:hypothetical protein